MVAPPEIAPAPALGAETAGAAIGSQTQPALFIITTNAPNFIPTLVQTCSHSVTRSFGVVSEVARAVSQPLRKRSAESAPRAIHLIRVLHKTTATMAVAKRPSLRICCRRPKQKSTNLAGGFIAFALHRYL